MTNLATAKKLMNILEKKEFKTFLVGGVVRDYLLKQPINDIDITTSAIPPQVMKMFDTKLTGIKYGTVTVLFENETFEVTTFRKDGPSKDFRHPDSVIYTDSEVEDVERRDFTINGLLMNKNGQIFDYVNGLEDLKNQKIRAIGDPIKRFEEDALRILRAIYFESKLGFKIEEKTKLGMQEQRYLLNEIANERILAELLKLLKGEFVLNAFKTMVETKVHEQLAGLSKGIEYLAKSNKVPFIDTFFTMCFILNNGIIPSVWKFSSKHRIKYQKATEIALRHPFINQKVLYQYGIEYCLLANKANAFLKRSELAEKKIMTLYDSLPLKSELDLKLTSSEMIQLANKKAGAWVSQIRIKMVNAILDNEIQNTKVELSSYLLKALGVKSND